MSPRSDLKNRLARGIAAHAARVGTPEQAEWLEAMIREQHYLPPDESALSWALGCVLVSYQGRIRAMISLPKWLRWIALLVMFLLCLIPPCWNFIYITLSAAHGYPLSSGERLMFGSATLIGPLGLTAALWTLSSRSHRPGTGFMVVLWALTAWAITLVRLPPQYPLLTHTAPGSGTFTIILNFVLLPVLGVALLQTLDVRRRRLPD